jgi:putative ATPase
MGDLFAQAARERQEENAPLATRLRPRTLDQLVGQQHVLGEGSALRLAIEQDRPPSMILFGPPGTGKTTIARIVAERTGATFEELSAVSARVDDVRAVLTRARDRLGSNGLRTILFIDEIHRFNKGQQDSVLHAVEDALVTLIGATTENPYFEVNSALLSRCTVIELVALDEDELSEVVRRGAAALDAEIDDDLVRLIAGRAGGDARGALQILELAHETAHAEGATLAEAHVLDASRKRPLMYDRKGDQHYDFASAFIKSMRGGNADASV